MLHLVLIISHFVSLGRWFLEAFSSISDNSIPALHKMHSTLFGSGGEQNLIPGNTLAPDVPLLVAALLAYKQPSCRSNASATVRCLNNFHWCFSKKALFNTAIGGYLW